MLKNKTFRDHRLSLDWFALTMPGGKVRYITERKTSLRKNGKCDYVDMNNVVLSIPDHWFKSNAVAMSRDEIREKLAASGVLKPPAADINFFAVCLRKLFTKKKVNESKEMKNKVLEAKVMKK